METQALKVLIKESVRVVLSSPGKKKQVILQYVNRLKKSINTYGSTGKSISK